MDLHLMSILANGFDAFLTLHDLSEWADEPLAELSTFAQDISDFVEFAGPGGELSSAFAALSDLASPFAD